MFPRVRYKFFVALVDALPNAANVIQV